MQCLEIELLDRLRRHEAHARTLHRFGDRLGVCEVVLLPPELRLHVLCRHQPGVMAERPKLSAQMVRANARLHSDQARRHIGKPHNHLAAGQFAPLNDVPSSPMRWKLFLPISMPIVVTWSVALRVMVRAPSAIRTQNHRVRLGARSVHPISGSKLNHSGGLPIMPSRALSAHTNV